MRYGFLSEDFVVLPGGADIHPSIYGKENYKSNIYGPEPSDQDRLHINQYYDAVKKGKPIFGICRGHQLIAALNGLTLIQDMKHPSEHNIKIRNLETGIFDTEILTNSAHHQLVWTKNIIEDENFKVFGYSSIATEHHYTAKEEIKCIIEPEILWFPKVKALTVQFHPEWMHSAGFYRHSLTYIKDLINKLY